MICFFYFAVLKESENIADPMEEKPYGDQGTMSKLISITLDCPAKGQPNAHCSLSNSWNNIVALY